MLDGVRSVRPRRACCSACQTTHVIVPAWSVPQRRDGAEVIGHALLAKAHGDGHRKIAARLQRPPSTVRGWLRAFARRAEAVQSSALALGTCGRRAAGAKAGRLAACRRSGGSRQRDQSVAVERSNVRRAVGARGRAHRRTASRPATRPTRVLAVPAGRAGLPHDLIDIQLRRWLRVKRRRWPTYPRRRRLTPAGGTATRTRHSGFGRNVAALLRTPFSFLRWQPPFCRYVVRHPSSPSWVSRPSPSWMSVNIALVPPFAVSGESAVRCLNRRTGSAAEGARCRVCGAPGSRSATRRPLRTLTVPPLRGRSTRSIDNAAPPGRAALAKALAGRSTRPGPASARPYRSRDRAGVRAGARVTSQLDGDRGLVTLPIR